MPALEQRWRKCRPAVPTADDALESEVLPGQLSSSCTSMYDGRPGLDGLALPAAAAIAAPGIRLFHHHLIEGSTSPRLSHRQRAGQLHVTLQTTSLHHRPLA